MGTLEMAANILGRLRRAWPEAFILSRPMAKELAVPLAQEAGMEDDLDGLIEMAMEAHRDVEEKFPLRTVVLTLAFREPSYPVAHRRAQDSF